MQPGLSVSSETQRAFDNDKFLSAVQSKGIHVSFGWTMVRLKSADPEKNGKKERRLVLIKQPIGDPSTCSTSFIAPEVAAKIYPVEWKYFTETGEMPVTGTPLSELPGITNSQIQIMNLSGFRSIEDVLSVAAEVFGGRDIEARAVRDLAEKWRANRDQNADVINSAAQKTAFDSQIASEKAARERAEAEVVAMRARLQALEALVNGNSGGARPVLPGSSGQPERVDSDLPGVDETVNPLADAGGDDDDDDPLGN